ncbi:MAG: carbamoyltransferase C-terminal domain-containing protein [Actinophytocola sp.]|uniref:carbamoyltransferase family protein n=1 Tax=Actinophytocola sp. TaxID=1872138 RepID=UPI003C731BC9
MTRTVVLGINGAHDSAACLLIDGKIVVALPEERISRRKYHEGYPHEAVAYCLRSAGLNGLDDVDAVVINQYIKDDFGLMVRQPGFTGEVIVNPSHHMLHAYYAWVASGYARPAILILDGSGYSHGEHERQGSPLLGPPPPYSEMEEAESMYVVDERGDALNLLRKRWELWESRDPYQRFPSLGHMYSVATEYIFGNWQHAGKTMGLAPYGDPSRLADPIIEYRPEGMRIDTGWVTRLPPRSNLPAHEDPVCRDVAAKVQAELERAVVHLCDVLYEATGADELCLSGGVGLNSVANGLILRNTRFSRFFVTPAAGDSGVAIGAALYGHHRLTGVRPHWSSYDDYHGHTYSVEDVQEAIDDRAGFVEVTEVPDPIEAAVQDMVSGKFVGWFEGASEFGPRALGHRSIVCDPRPPDMRARLNATVKFREPFRPYAASVLGEHVNDYFDTVDIDPFMMTVAPLVNSAMDVIASVSHVDDTCRIQTVAADHPGMYRRLIERFHERTGIPLVLNTSFNIRGEPIIETPADALRCFLGCNLDVVYLDGRRINKIVLNAQSVEIAASYVPSLNDSVSVGSLVENEQGAAGPTRFFCQTRTGHRTAIGAEDHVFLCHVDLVRSIGEIAVSTKLGTVAEVVRRAVDLQQRGLISVRKPVPRSDSPTALARRVPVSVDS